ncbi:nodulation receptor kinase-like [Bidens hawaiensis]|uniref:nodulation receptor kinase-like n=1 Tax=Bidens hawaiensis TaxID=980011 RepID=UPI00404ADEA5
MSTDIYNCAHEHLDDHSRYSIGYVDPKYQKDVYISSERLDIYSLGVILLELLCGRVSWAEGCEGHSQSLGPLAVRQYYKQNTNLDEMIFKGIKEQIVPKSLSTFVFAAINCLDCYSRFLSKATTLVKELKEALEFQVSFHIFTVLGAFAPQL